MIQTKACTLDALDYVARNLADGESVLYEEMTGFEFAPSGVAAALYLSGGRLWQFWDAVERIPVAVGGYTCVRRGVWQSVFMSTPDAWASGKGITKRVAECVQAMFEDPSIQRLETATLATRTSARAWYERIGLHYESTACKASASGQDLVTYVALRG